MTVTATSSRVEYAGNGATVAFTVPFYFLENADLKVYKAGTLQTITTHYTVSGAGNPAGGTVTFLSAPAASQSIVIFRDPAMAQDADYVENDPFPAQSHERALDKLTMIAQRIRELVNRSFRLSDSDTSGASTIIPTPAAYKLIGWNSAGTELQNYDSSDIASVATYSNWLVQTFSGDGSTTTFTLTDSPMNVANTDVSIDGVTQVPGVDYNLGGSGLSLVFGTAPGNGSVVCCRYGQSASQGKDDASIIYYLPAGTGGVSRSVQSKLRDTVNTSEYSLTANYRTAKNSLSTNYNDMLVRSWLTPQPQLLSEELSKQRPAWYSFPRLMKKIADYNTASPVTIKIVGFGSSVGVGASLPDPATQAPVAKFTSVLKSVLDPASIYSITAHNYCVNGSTVSESIARFDVAVGAGDTPSLCVLAYGMNDGGVAIFNAGQTYPAVYTSILQFVAKARAAGSDVILMTTPHPHTGRYTYSMPSVIGQVYPTSVSAPVAAEALIPPASQSNITGDFLGDGSSITIAHRHWRVNQAMRQAATDCGIPLIDVERYWFKALQKYALDDLYNPGETVHPNLLGHQVSYHQAITDFLYSMSYQVSQEGQEPRLNGLVGVNQSLPTSALDVHLPYPETTKPSISIKARIGQADGNGVRANVKRLEVENTGDIVRYAAKTTDSTALESRRESYLLDGTGTYVSEVSDTVKVSNSSHKTLNSSAYNVSGTVNLYTLPNNCTGTLYASGYQNGVGRQIIRAPFVVQSGAVTIGAIESTASAGSVFTSVTSSGFILQIVCFAANTNISYKIEINTGF